MASSSSSNLARERILVPVAMLFMLLVHLLGVYLFTTGFLLTRLELPRSSSCVSPASAESMTAFAAIHDSDSGAFTLALQRWKQAGMPGQDFTNNTNTNTNSSSSTTGCWTKRRFDRAVIVLVDALRYDFARDMMPSLRKLLDERPGNSRLHVFEADPPTTTLQRLKALMTGGMPTFVDVGSNFNSDELVEDNLVDQLASNHHTLVMMGDDTWMALFPKQFTRAYPYPSFNVKDLHTVDNGVLRHLMPEIRSGAYDVLMAHFLGVDHIGHRYRADHPAMKPKLAQIDAAIGRLAQEMDDDTVLFVFGDHGMTSDGNHGGTSPIETDAALFVYSPRQMFDPSSSSANVEYRVKQVDFVPTLALLMGVPVPYGSLGMVIGSLFEDASEPIAASMHLLRRVEALRVNAWQVQQYLHEYATHSKIFETERMQLLTSDFLAADAIYLDTISRDGVSIHAEEVLFDLIHRYEGVMALSGRICREKWTTFDMTSMLWGLSVLLAAFLGHGAFVLMDNGSIFSSFPSVTVGFGAIAALLPAFILELGSILSLEMVHWILRLFGAAFSGALITTAIVIGFRALSSGARPSVAIVLSVAMVVAYAQGLFSNCLVEAEGESVAYISVTLAMFLGILQPGPIRTAKTPRFSGIMVGAVVAVCVRAMGDGVNFGPGTLSVPLFTAASQLLQTYGSLLGIVVLHVLVQHKHLFNQCVGVLVVAVIGVYWWIETVRPEETRLAQLLPQIVYAISVIGMFAVLFLGKRANRLSLRSRFALVVGLASAPLLLLLGPRSPRVLFFALIAVWALSHMRIAPRPATIMLWMIGLRMYFATGHLSIFSSLQVSAAFVGFDQFSYYRSGLMLALNTFSGYALASLLLGLWFVLNPANIITVKREEPLSVYVARALFAITFLHTVRATLTMINAVIQRRHLMVWEIFAPKFVFDCTTLFFVDAFNLVVVGICIRLDGTQQHHAHSS